MSTFSLQLDSEFVFKTSRSGGKGGQNVNKVSTKVELNFDVLNSVLLNAVQKRAILNALSKRINKDGVLKLVVQSSRSQFMNKELAIEKFYTLINKCFEVQKKRIATKPNKSAKEKRLKGKKIHSEKKELRKRMY